MPAMHIRVALAVCLVAAATSVKAQVTFTVADEIAFANAVEDYYGSSLGCDYTELKANTEALTFASSCDTDTFPLEKIITCPKSCAEFVKTAGKNCTVNLFYADIDKYEEFANILESGGKLNDGDVAYWQSRLDVVEKVTGVDEQNKTDIASLVVELPQELASTLRDNIIYANSLIDACGFSLTSATAAAASISLMPVIGAIASAACLFI